jgi:MSHA biogenesis protein MshN
LTSRAEKAIDLLMRDKPLVAENFSYYELLGLAARKNNQFTLSEQAYRGLLEANSARGDWWVGLAVALDAQGNMGGARSAYNNALKTVEISAPLRDYARQRLTAMGASSDLGA